MKFMLMFKVEPGNEERGPACKTMPEMEAFVEKLRQEGTLLAAEGLAPSDKGAKVSRAGGKVSVKDGPFTEAKELVAGFSLVEVPSKAAAVELAQQFLKIAGEGVCEAREVI